MTAARYKLIIEQGANLRENFVYKDSAGALVDLTGYEARAMVRQSISDSSPVLSMSTADGRITLGDEEGTIAIDVPAAVTADVVLSGLGFWDLELVEPGGGVVRLLEGRAQLRAEVTR